MLTVDDVCKELTSLLEGCLSVLENLKYKREQFDLKFQKLIDNQKYDITYKIKTTSTKQINNFKVKIIDNLIMIEGIKFQKMSRKRITLLKKPSNQPVKSAYNIQKLESINEIIRLSEENDLIRKEIKKIKDQNNKEEEQNVVEVYELTRIKECAKHLKYKPVEELELIIRDCTSPENKKIMEYAQAFNSNSHEGVMPYDVIYTIRDLIFDSRNEMVERLQIDSTQVDLSIENYLFPLIYPTIISNLNLEKQDLHLENQCKRFASATQEQFNINAKLIDNQYIPYYPAISLLRTVIFSLTPSRKLFTIIQAAKEVFDITSKLQPGESIGGDLFTDIWVYIVTKAQIKSLATTVAYITDYGNDELLQGEMGYYFTAMSLASNYLKNLTEEKLKENKKCVLASGPFLVFEKTKYKRFCETFKHINIVEEIVVMKGYKLFVRKEYLQNIGRFYCTYLRRSRNPNDHVVGMKMQANEGITSNQLEFLYNIFFTNNKDQNLKVEFSINGSFFIDPSPPPPSPSDFLVHSGDFDMEIDSIKVKLNLQKMNYNVITDFPPYLSYDQLDHFYETFKIDQSEEILSSTLNLVKRTQIALIHLNFISNLCEIDGMISVIFTASLIKFQEYYNQTSSSNLSDDQSLSIEEFLREKSNVIRPKVLPSMGILTKETFDCIMFRLNDCIQGLNEIGFAFDGDPIEDRERLSKHIGIFQKEKLNRIPNFSFDEKTISSIISELSSLRSKSDPL